MTTTQLAPHCIGQAVSFSQSAPTCKQCPYSVDCAKRVMTRLKEINETLDVSDIMITLQAFLDKNGVLTESIESGGKVRFATSSSFEFDIETDLSECGIRSEKIARTILKRGIDMKADALRGDNKLINVKPTYLKSIQDIINSQGEFTHEELKQIIKADRPNCKDSAVNNNASFAAQALIAIKVLEKIGDKYVLTC